MYNGQFTLSPVLQVLPVFGQTGHRAQAGGIGWQYLIIQRKIHMAPYIWYDGSLLLPQFNQVRTQTNTVKDTNNPHTWEDPPASGLQMRPDRKHSCSEWFGRWSSEWQNDRNIETMYRKSLMPLPLLGVTPLLTCLKTHHYFLQFWCSCWLRV